MKKAQMEIMGLAVIVILITLGMLFVVQFVILKPAPETRKAFIQTQTAANTLTTLLRTSTGCKKTTIMELLQDCADHTTDKNNRICCDGGIGYSSPSVPEETACTNPPGGQDSCGTATGLITAILSKSLDAYGIKNYEFRAVMSGDPGSGTDFYQPIDPIRKGECLESKESKQAYFQVDRSIVTLYLDVC